MGREREAARAEWVLPPRQGTHGKKEMGSSLGAVPLLSQGSERQSA